MKEIPTVKDDAVPERMAFLIPPLTAIVYEPAGGFSSFEERLGAEQAALLAAATKAARENRIGCITNIGE